MISQRKPFTSTKGLTLTLNTARVKSTYEKKHLTLQQRKTLRIDGYYHPFTVDANRVVHGKRRYRSVKRVFDVLLSCAALLVTWPIILVFMIAIYIEDPNASPVFRQERIRKNGKPFVMYKLRSMYANAEDVFDHISCKNEAQSKAFKMKCDPRITKVGRIARKFSIDELLQFVNIIKSDMSIVGPRPPLPREVDFYDDYDRQRLLIKPGLTCFWQVMPGRHEISFEDWVALDIKYLLNRSLGTDLMLILKTFSVIFSGKGD